MAKLWEDTIVMAIRDMQWNALLSKGKRPAAGITKLDGNAEKELGDLVFKKDEKLYLIEVKSGREDIKYEWYRADRTGYKTFNPKSVYKKLAHIVNGHSKNQDVETLKLSLLCHFVAYWNDDHGILFEPYINALCGQSKNISEHDKTIVSENIINKLPFDSAFGYLQWNANFQETIALPFDFIFHDRAIIYGVENNAINMRKGRPVGLDRMNFQKYINAIVNRSGGSHEEIHAIIMDSNGSHFRIVRDTSDFSYVFYNKSSVESELHARSFDRHGKLIPKKMDGLNHKL